MSLGQKIPAGSLFNRDEYILSCCQNRRVLHVGCTCYPVFQAQYDVGRLLHKKLAPMTAGLVGIDIAKADIQALKSFGYNVYEMNAEQMTDLRNKKDFRPFDTILLADVVEHIHNPGQVLAAAKTLLNPGGEIIISVPNAFGIVRFLKSFFQYEQVHPDHIAYYSSGTLGALAERHGLIMTDVGWYRFEVHEKRPLVYIAAGVERFFTTFFPWQAEGCLVKLSLPQPA
jgi:SAM-dependent methyltransferase